MGMVFTSVVPRATLGGWSRVLLSPLRGLFLFRPIHPRLAPWAAFLRRFAAFGIRAWLRALRLRERGLLELSNFRSATVGAPRKMSRRGACEAPSQIAACAGGP